MNLIFRPHWFDMKRFCSSLVSSQAACCLPAGIIPKISKQIKFGNWYSLPRNSRCTQDDVVSFRQIHHWGIYCLSVFFLKLFLSYDPSRSPAARGHLIPSKERGCDSKMKPGQKTVFLFFWFMWIVFGEGITCKCYEIMRCFHISERLVLAVEVSSVYFLTWPVQVKFSWWFRLVG